MTAIRRALRCSATKSLAVRLGGIYALQSLAEEHSEQYHAQIMRLFCAFVRHPTKDKKLESEPKAVELGPTMTQDVLARYADIPRGTGAS